MQKYLAVVSYLGTNYHGWQKQKNQHFTIQEIIQNTFLKVFHQTVEIVGSGRTDAGVSATHQCFHFVWDQEIPTDNMMKAVNAHLPSDIRILGIKKVADDFQARFDVKKKTYLYQINTGTYDVFQYPYVYQYCRDIDLVKIQKCAQFFLGKHNFLSFCTEMRKNNEREIYAIDVTKKCQIISIKVVGNGFLKNMVRMIVGSLLALNENKLTESKIRDFLNYPRKGQCPFKASPNGLCLVDVDYVN